MEARKAFLISLTDFGVRIKILNTEFDASFIRRCSQLGVNSQFHLDHYDEKNGPWVYLFYNSYVDPVEKLRRKPLSTVNAKLLSLWRENDLKRIAKSLPAMTGYFLPVNSMVHLSHEVEYWLKSYEKDLLNTDR